METLLNSLCYHSPMLSTDLIAQLKTDRRALSRLLTQAESGSADSVLDQIQPHTGSAHRIGLTGSPGAGKSTLAAALALHYRKQSRTVAILAVDPSSAVTGGAILGDRVRMRELSGDSGVFIRSLAARGSGDGLSRAVTDCMDILDAAGFDLILVETVGAGQDQTAIADLVHTTVLVEAPGMGDDVQALKAGLLESAHILIVNKADLPGAEATVRALQDVITYGRFTGWTPPILQATATTGIGIDKIAEQIDAHRAWLQVARLDPELVRDRQRQQIQSQLAALLLERFLTNLPESQFAVILDQVADRRLSIRQAAQQLLKGDSELYT